MNDFYVLENGSMTPPLTRLALDIMKKIAKRKDISIISDEKAEINIGMIINKLNQGKYEKVKEWKNDFISIIENNANDGIKNAVSQDVLEQFGKKYSFIKALSHFRFKSELKNAIYELEQLFGMTPGEYEELKSKYGIQYGKIMELT